jgi:hypothetical protein
MVMLPLSQLAEWPFARLELGRPWQLNLLLKTIVLPRDWPERNNYFLLQYVKN